MHLNPTGHYHERLNDYRSHCCRQNMRSVSNANTLRAIVLSSLMILMTQAGFLDSLNAWSAEEETLDQTNDVLETGGSGASNFTASVEGADLIIDEAMTNITFQYNASAASGSGSGSGTTTNGNGTTWQVADINSGADSSYPGNYMEILVGDTLYFRSNNDIRRYQLSTHYSSNSSP